MVTESSLNHDFTRDVETIVTNVDPDSCFDHDFIHNVKIMIYEDPCPSLDHDFTHDVKIMTHEDPWPSLDHDFHNVKIMTHEDPSIMTPVM